MESCKKRLHLHTRNIIPVKQELEEFINALESLYSKNALPSYNNLLPYFNKDGNLKSKAIEDLNDLHKHPEAENYLVKNRLHDLEEFFLANNLLSDLPEEIREELTNLGRLNVNDNQLKTLPLQILKMKKMRDFKYDNNPDLTGTAKFQRHFQGDYVVEYSTAAYAIFGFIALLLAITAFREMIGLTEKPIKPI